MQRLTENTIEDIVNRSVNHKNMNNSNDLNIDNKYKVLFVCLGNICRSPAAEAMLRCITEREGLDDRVYIDSAGTYGGHSGELSDPRMRRAAAARGIEMTHRARQVREADFERFDMIICMDDNNYEALFRLAPDRAAQQKIYRFREFLRHNPDCPTSQTHTTKVTRASSWCSTYWRMDAAPSQTNSNR